MKDEERTEGKTEENNSAKDSSSILDKPKDTDWKITEDDDEEPSKIRGRNERNSDYDHDDDEVEVIDDEVDEEEDFDEDELPDLESFDPKNEKFYSDEIVWVMTHGLWWPSFVLKTYPKENKASILFINCQQKTPIKVYVNRMKTFSYLDYSDIFESQKDKAAGLTEAMNMANLYREVKAEGTINLSPRDFFSLPLSEQRSILDQQILEMKELAALAKAKLEGPCSSLSPAIPVQTIDDDDDEEIMEIESRSPINKTEEISDDRLSERDLLKLASATKARRTSNERFVRFIKSESCSEHLRKICSGKLPSERHDYFMENHANIDFLMVVPSVFNIGLDFFGDDDIQQTEEVLTYLLNKFDKEEMDSSLDSSSRRVYVNTVFLPEAIKESLRSVAKIPEEELETVLKNGLFHTRTELKAKRLDYL